MNKAEKAITNSRGENDGFSLLELVVAVGILLVLTVGGLLAYNGIIKQARIAAVTNAASTVYSQAMIYKTDNNPKTTIQTAADEWNESAGVVPDEAAIVNTVAAIGVNNEKIKVIATDLANDSFEIKAVYGDENSDDRIEAVKRSPEINTSSKPEVPVIPEPEVPATRMTFYCDGSSLTGRLPIGDIDSNTEILLNNEKVNIEAAPAGLISPLNDISPITLNNTSEQVHLEANTTYTLEIRGEFDKIIGFTSENSEGDTRSHDTSLTACLTSIDEISESANVKQISWLGADESPLTKMPNQLPRSVVSLEGAFVGLSFFNQDISNWDISNVVNMNFMLFENYGFNQDISNWDTSGVLEYEYFAEESQIGQNPAFIPEKFRN